MTASVGGRTFLVFKNNINDNYVSYSAALEMCGLDDLATRRNKRQLAFAVKCVKSDFNTKMFPLNSPGKKEKFKVNFARTESYQE